MAVGYSSLMVTEINNANQLLLGVKLGRACVARDIPVTDVAKFLGTSRVTVYSWFRGKVEVSDKYASRVQELVDQLK
jgi:predicted transcriptional regulator